MMIILATIPRPSNPRVFAQLQALLYHEIAGEQRNENERWYEA
jgi:hypothetical protein